MLLSDKKTNTLSLSKLQAFLWTIIIFWSYLYLALGKMLIMCDFSIPQLDLSLIELLGISYGGLIAARGLGNTRPKNDLVTTEQKISDFFSENNEISLPRLQLFIFTFVGIAIYILNLFNPELFDKGLPEIPGTLNGLFLVSQGGYLGGKLTGSTVVNYLLPHRIKSGATTDIMLVGQGFTDHTKLLLQGTQSPIETIFFNQNTLGFKLSTQAPDIGMKQLVLIPPSGSSFVVDNALEIIKVAIRKTMTVGVGGDDTLDVEFEGIVLNGEPLTAHLGEAALSITHVARNRYRVARPGGLTTGDTIRIAAQDGSFAFETTVNGTATEGYEPVTLL